MSNYGLPLFSWADARPTAEIVDLGRFRQTSPRWKMKLGPNEIPPGEALDRCLKLAPPTPVVAFAHRRA